MNLYCLKGRGRRSFLYAATLVVAALLGACSSVSHDEFAGMSNEKLYAEARDELATGKCPMHQTVALLTTQAPMSECFRHNVYFDLAAEPAAASKRIRSTGATRMVLAIWHQRNSRHRTPDSPGRDCPDIRAVPKKKGKEMTSGENQTAPGLSPRASQG